MRVQGDEEQRAAGELQLQMTGQNGLWSEYDGRLTEVWEEIVALGLEKHVAELEALGYTVLDPQVPVEVIEAMRESIFRRAEAHWGPGARDASVFAASDRDMDITPTIRIGDLASEPAFVT